jgi:hypothetical protein
MFDVFTEEIEVMIKDGLAHLYWYKGDLHKAWLRSGVDTRLCDEIGKLCDDEGKTLTKRKQMDSLYQRLRNVEYNRRLEVSRNFVRILVEHKTFVPQDPKHRIEIAERAALKLKGLLTQQEKDREHKEAIKQRARKASVEDYHSRLSAIREKFLSSQGLPSTERGYALEKIFTELMLISQITAHEPFRIKGEQIDGGIKYDGHYYLIELKWTKEKADPKEIASFLYKVEGKLDARGIMISMNGYTNGVLESLPRGKELKILLLDGVHLTNVISGLYSFKELLEHAVSQASLKANLFCAYDLSA